MDMIDSDTQSSATDPELLGQFSWTVDELARNWAPRWSHRNKIAIANTVTPPGTVHEGSMTATRWRGGSLPAALTCPEVVKQRGFFTYPVPEEGDPTTHWHMNFADKHLFGFGEGSLLAQDELQITEHPSLASIAYAIEDGGHGAAGLLRLTKTSSEGATPVLIEGAPRRCALDTNGIYGDYFGMAREERVLAQTKVLDPPTISNILALSAMEPKYGYYSKDQITNLFQTAYRGFRATVLRSGRVTLHTGYWGCGAFGGNKGLVSAVQFLAAGTAGIERLHFWYGFTELDSTAFDHALAVGRLLSGGPTEDIINALAASGYAWGQANENYVPFTEPENSLVPRAS